MQVHVMIRAKEAIQAAKAVCGERTVRLTEDDLGKLTDVQRAELGQMRGVGEDPLPATDRLQVIEPTLEAIQEALQKRIIEKAKKAHARSEQDARERERMIKSVSEWADKAEADPDCMVKNRCIQVPWGRSAVPADSPLAARVAHLLTQAETIRNEQEAAYKAGQEAAETERLARIAKYKTEREAWIGKYGSRRLRLLLAEGMGLDKTYRQERMAAERPGWVSYQDLCGITTSIRDASEEALEALLTARGAYPETQLVWLDACDTELDEYTGQHPCDYNSSYPRHNSRAVLADTFLGDTIIHEV